MRNGYEEVKGAREKKMPATSLSIPSDYKQSWWGGASRNRREGSMSGVF